MYILLNNNRMIKNKLNNYLIPLQNDRLTHVNPKLYTKCPLKIFKPKPSKILPFPFIFLVCAPWDFQ
jgi:hypothetical protein